MKKAFGYLLVFALFFAAGFFSGRRGQKNAPEAQVTIKTDSVFIVDTLVVEKPVFRHSRTIDTIRLYFTTVEKDTVLVDLPREQRVYAEDSLYRAVVSGVLPRLDSLTIYPQRTIITTERTERAPRSRFGVGVAAGPSVLATPKGNVHAGVGATIGITYRF